MAHSKKERRKANVIITTKDWLMWIKKEKQKTRFKHISMTEMLDEIIVSAFLNAEKEAKEEEKRKKIRREKIKSF